MALSSSFALRSITKSFTVTLLQEVQAGWMALDDKVTRWVNASPDGALPSRDFNLAQALFEKLAAVVEGG